MKCGTQLTVLAEPVSTEIPNLERQFVTLHEAMPASFREQLMAPNDGENRLVTVLFADMSSSVATTQGMAPDEAAELVNKLLKAMVDALTRYEGRVDRFLGDGALAVFGTPYTHENDPERAILAAQEIREKARELGLRVTAGINTGRVYFGTMGSEEHQEITVMGPVVNLAARFQGEADSGEILIGEATQRHVRRTFELKRRNVRIKGIEDDVPVYRVERQLPRTQKVRGLEGATANLIGRDSELAQLIEAYEITLTGEGQLVCLIGEAGLGKTRLVTELRRHVETAQKPTLWLDGRCVELDVSPSYWPFIDLFREYFGLTRLEEAGAPARKIHDSIKALVAKASLSENRENEMCAIFGRLLSVRFGDERDSYLDGADTEAIRNMTFLAIRDFFLALAKASPVVVVLDDLHWADSTTIDVISLLMESLTMASLVIVCVYRPDREHRCFQIPTVGSRKCPERFAEISLKELSPAECRRMIQSLLEVGDLPSDLRSMILEKSQGNPLFVEEVIRSLIDSRVIFLEDNMWKTCSETVDVAVPETVQGIILSRVDRLDNNLKRLLQSASVIGRLFGKRLLETIARHETELDKSLAQLEDTALIYQERAVPEQEFAFKHVLARDAVYDSIVKEARVRFHENVANAIQKLYSDALDEYNEELAYHFERSQNEPQARKYLLRAAQKAQRAYATENALVVYKKLIERFEPTTEITMDSAMLLEALSGYGAALLHASKDEEAMRCLMQACELGERTQLPPSELIPIYHDLGGALTRLGKFDEHKSLTEKCLSLVGPDDRSAHAAMAFWEAAYSYKWRGNPDRWREYIHNIERFVLDLPASPKIGMYIRSIAAVYRSESDLPNAEKWIDIAEQKGRDINDLSIIAASLQLKGDLRHDSGDMVGALRYTREALSFAEKTGFIRPIIAYRNQIAVCLIKCGEPEKALSVLPTQSMLESVGSSHIVLWTHNNTVTARISCGDYDEAEKVALELLESEPNLDTKIQCGILGIALEKRDWAIKCFAEAADELNKSETDEAARRWYAAHIMSGISRSDTEDSFDVDTYPAIQEMVQASQVTLIPTNTGAERYSEHILDTVFQNGDLEEWRWIDHFGDCRYRSDEGLVIHAANERKLGGNNHSAPRLMRMIDGDMAIQTKTIQPECDCPPIGGILIWVDQRNYTYLVRGLMGPNEVSFFAVRDGDGTIIGRGPAKSDSIELRIERRVDRLQAKYCIDEEHWLSVGSFAYDLPRSISIGLIALGSINRLIYPGRFASGTESKFEKVDIWQDKFV